jgi:hypothetical protein
VIVARYVNELTSQSTRRPGGKARAARRETALGGDCAVLGMPASEYHSLRMRVVFHARRWSAEVLIEVERHWRRHGPEADCHYITHHLQSARELRARAARLTLIPAAIRQLEIAYPIRELARIEARCGGTPRFRSRANPRRSGSSDAGLRTGSSIRPLGTRSSLSGCSTSSRRICSSASRPTICPPGLPTTLRLHGCEPIGMTPSLPPGRLGALAGRARAGRHPKQRALGAAV